MAFLNVASGASLLNCPFLVSAEHPACCHDAAPKQCPLSNSFDTCPSVALDGRIEQARGQALAAPPPAISRNEGILRSIRLEGQATGWTPSLSDLHIRIRVLLI
jgi:hypothetical protein